MRKERKPNRTGTIKPTHPRFCKLCNADISELDYRRQYCDACREKRPASMRGATPCQMAWRERNKERLKAERKAKLDAIKADPEAYEQLKAKWRERWKKQKDAGKTPNKEHLKRYVTQWRKENRDYINRKNKFKRRQERQQVLDHYGKVCACCGEWRYEFLSIDHIDGGGNKHRNELKQKGELKKAGRMHDWLRKNNYPEGFRVLCHNCNQARGLYGYCPHKPDENKDQVVE